MRPCLLLSKTLLFALAKVLVNCTGLHVYCDSAFSSMAVLFGKICKAFRIAPPLARLLVKKRDRSSGGGGGGSSRRRSSSSSSLRDASGRVEGGNGHRPRDRSDSSCHDTDNCPFVTDFATIPVHLYRDGSRGSGKFATVLEASAQIEYVLAALGAWTDCTPATTNPNTSSCRNVLPYTTCALDPDVRIASM